MSTSRAATPGLLIALAGAVALGTNVVSAQLAGQAGVSGPLLVFYRVFLMLPLAGAAVLAWRLSVAVPVGDRGAILVFGLASAFVGSAYLSSVAFIPVTVAAVILYTFPVFVVIAEPFLTPTRFSFDKLLVALVAFVGVALVVGPDLGGLDPRGLVLALASSLFAATQFFSANAAARTPVAAKLIWSHVIILPVTAMILLATGGFQPPTALAAAPVAVAVTIGGYLIGFVLQVMALARIGPGPTALVFCAEPLIAVAIAAIVLDERVGPLQYAGGALVVGAIMANVILEQKRAARLAAA